MNCNQAQALIAAYRELEDGTIENTEMVELDAHLAECASCQAILARYRSLGEQIRSISALEPLADMHANLMQALAVEHTRFLQRSASATPPLPEFLKPYVHEHLRHASTTDPLVAFSTAETGPLPVLREHRAKRQRAQIPQMAVLGLVAVFLMAIMMGGITSLLLLGHTTTSQLVSTSLNQPATIVKLPYTTTTQYNHVVSAVADSNNIYYTAYADTASKGWMLEELDRTTQLSIPLLNTPVDEPLIVLGTENGWLVWLQFDVPTAAQQKNPLKPGEKSLVRSWSLNYLPVQSIQQLTDMGQMKPMTLVSGTFNQDLVPDWVHTPIQGIWFQQNNLLVAMIDSNGSSQLVSYHLGSANNAKPTVIAQAQSHHILTSPTANSDGTRIYWADEWQTDDGFMHSDIWTQQMFSAPRAARGYWVNHSITVKEPFTQNGMSFRPQVVNNTLFLLSTANINTLTQPAATATANTAKATPTVTPTPVSTAPTVSWADQTIYEAQIDEAVQGTILSYALDGSTQQPTIIDSRGPASALQAGNRFLLWQTEGGYQMYDVVEGISVATDSMLDNARFLAVNGNTTVWMNPQTLIPAAGQQVTLDVFNWPRSNGK
ncbi:MAG TPA: zf-HC2 domain-containing protein [Ktedonobacteraceae bacterium]|nr:zf-HC2 domain-containing protein [Ktedonobacteraceae bacterium]